MVKSAAITEADILADVVGADRADLPPEVAGAILDLQFSKPAVRRMRQLLQKNNLGTITAQERVTLERYLRVGQFLDLWQAKAKRSLKRAADQD